MNNALGIMKAAHDANENRWCLFDWWFEMLGDDAVRAMDELQESRSPDGMWLKNSMIYQLAELALTELALRHARQHPSDDDEHALVGGA